MLKSWTWLTESFTKETFHKFLSASAKLSQQPVPLIDMKLFFERAWVYGASYNFSACQSFINFSPSASKDKKESCMVVVGGY